MPGQSWSVNAEGGYLANPKLSKQIRHAAQPLCKFRQFTRPEPGFGKNKSDTIEFDRIFNVTNAGGVISELKRMPETDMKISKGSLTVNEYGNSVPYTGKLEALSEFSVDNIWTVGLRDDMATVLDAAVGATFLECAYKYVATGTAGSPTQNIASTGIAGATATRAPQLWDLKNIVDYMKKPLLIPKYDGENYVCIASTAFLRAIKDDPDWEEAAKYGDPERLFSGEAGRIYGCRCIEETNYLPLVAGTTAYAGEAVFFGADPVVEGIVTPEEIRAKIPGDYGRSKGVAWYFLGGFATTWDQIIGTDSGVGKSKIIHYTSL